MKDGHLNLIFIAAVHEVHHCETGIINVTGKVKRKNTD